MRRCGAFMPIGSSYIQVRHDSSKGEKVSNTSLQFLLLASKINMNKVKPIQITVIRCLQYSNYFVVISGNIEPRTSVGTTATSCLVVSMFATL